MVDRPLYTERLYAELSAAPSVKLLVGMKRSGKSSILRLLRDELARRAVPKQNIIAFSFEGLENPDVTESAELYDAVAKKATAAEGRPYLFLDEPQRVYGWERAALHLLHDFDMDIYISGSSGAVVSPSALAILDEHCSVINVTTLSFAEYLTFRERVAKTEDAPRELARYIMTGGFPAL
ncbi:MAG: AAA family ATPase, partial [Oscillospiraceae bacterium]|nr:AAA family ATPase [Oscillospiraceae bacterium]